MNLSTLLFPNVVSDTLAADVQTGVRKLAKSNTIFIFPCVHVQCLVFVCVFTHDLKLKMNSQCIKTIITMFHALLEFNQFIKPSIIDNLN